MFKWEMSNAGSTKGQLKKSCSSGAIAGDGRMKTIIFNNSKLKIKYIFRSSIFQKAHTNQNVIDTHFNFYLIEM